MKRKKKKIELKIHYLHVWAKQVHASVNKNSSFLFMFLFLRKINKKKIYNYSMHLTKKNQM